MEKVTILSEGGLSLTHLARVLIINQVKYLITITMSRKNITQLNVFSFGSQVLSYHLLDIHGE